MEFMELKRAPAVLKAIAEAWIVAVGVVIFCLSPIAYNCNRSLNDNYMIGYFGSVSSKCFADVLLLFAKFSINFLEQLLN